MIELSALSNYKSLPHSEKKQAHLELAKWFLASETAERTEYLRACFRRGVPYNRFELAALNVKIADSEKAVADCTAALDK